LSFQVLVRFSKTSKPANNFSLSKAFTKATSSITPPRAQFNAYTTSFMIASSLITDDIIAGCKVIKSASLNKSLVVETIVVVIDCPSK
jgi:hypothetical protein